MPERADPPSSRVFVTQLLDSLRAVPLPPQDAADSTRTITASNTLTRAPESVRKLLLALHVLFPNEVLPALDLLDRRLVTRLRVQRCPPNLSDDAEHTIYYVRSAQTRSSRFTTTHETQTSYQVRLEAWNCSCPAFAFSAFPPISTSKTSTIPATISVPDTLPTSPSSTQEWSFGGLSLDTSMGTGDASTTSPLPPVCKHLLACVLVDRCAPLFGAFVEERVVDVEEACGWAAGWGD
ncbi:hypothetical protein P280DRAFT_518291 [Massarina eburnea CBS 473.64]|uniref:SWIM-type domain-containing protein n=1 Tax=Massarina eburnea CBS 473.64 TaxID=1395130 RepID=A0A6A6S1K3_9PLEO|nr:hypothetical protein P280DRAFT_518291 [Massarina eburnea CBS 473.64]